MNDRERYQDAVRRLGEYSYTVAPKGQGYIVQHITDEDDTSHARHIDDLVDFATLMKWRADHRKTLDTVSHQF